MNSTRVGAAPSRVRWLVLTVVTVVSLWIGLALAPPILFDDAAITLRYAERISNGNGFTYNDHERVNGASNPLWTLLIASGPRVGLDVEQADRVLSLLSFAGVSLLAAWLVFDVAGPVSAAAVGLALPFDVVWRTQALSGLEVPLAVTLGLAAILALRKRRETLAGVMIGLALWNKIDAAALLVAVTLGYGLAYGRLPLRLWRATAVVALPWCAFATLYFGSLVPHSLLVKISAGAVAPANPLWIVHFFLVDNRYWFWVGAAALAATIRREPPDVKFVATALGIWLAIHIVAYSVVSLGDTYPWYLGVPIVVSVALAAGAIRWMSLVSLLAVGVFALAAAPQVRESIRMLSVDRTPTNGEALDADRRLAGVFIDQFAGPNEVVESAFGWVAFESRRRFMDSSGLNSKTMLSPDYLVIQVAPRSTSSAGPDVPTGYVPLAIFNSASRLFSEMGWFMVYGRPASAIARSGKNETAVDVSRLHSDQLVRIWQSRLPSPATIR